jgi:arylsulfatase A-like enzyme
MLHRESPTAHRDRREIMSLAMGLAGVLLAVKFLLLPFPVQTAGQFVRWTLRLSIVASPDICFVAGLTLVCFVLERLARPSILARRLARVTWLMLFALAATYGVAALPIYHWTMVPLTLPALWLAGGGEMSSSIFARVGGGTLAALLLTPLALLAWAMCVVPRWPVIPRWRFGLVFGPRSSWLVPAFLGIAAYGIGCDWYIRAHWTDPNRWERRIAQSPHAVFLASCVMELVHGDVGELFGDPDESDFAPREVVSCESCCVPFRGKSPRNVVLIVLESTGVEYMGLYGSRHDTTPHLTRRAAEAGIIFDNIYVQSPSSCNSLAALVASVYPRPDWSILVRDAADFAVPTLAEVLVAQGYRTCFAHSGYWRYKQRDEFLRRRGAQTLIDAASLKEAGSVEEVNSWGVSDRSMFQATLDWIGGDGQKLSQQPFFLLAYTIETHDPYVVREPARDFGVKDAPLNRYLNSLRAADETIHWFLEELRRRGLDQDTLVAVTADHGESFGQHNQRIHSFCIYEPAVHVPLLLLYPGLRDRPRHIDAIGQHIDIAPTLLHGLGIDPPAEWQGRCLLAGIRDQGSGVRGQGSGDAPAFFFSVGNEMVLGLRDGRFKYHFYLSSGFEELFDTSCDGAEEHNLAASEAERCAGYKRRLGGFVRYQRRYLAERGVQ